jgi:hypothetical protein
MITFSLLVDRLSSADWSHPTFSGSCRPPAERFNSIPADQFNLLSKRLSTPKHNLIFSCPLLAKL